MKNQVLKKYRELLESTIVPMNLSIEDQLKISAPLNNFILDNTPQKLFRYRACTELNFDAFNKKQIWTSRSINMNDDFDARIYYNKKIINAWINDFIISDKSFTILSKIQSGEELPDNILSLPYGPEFVKFIKKLSREQLQQGSTYFLNYINDNFLKCVNELIEVAQRTLKFACFSETIESVSMWGLYADNGKGFALAYDFTNNNLSDCSSCAKLWNECIYPKKCHLMPINYSSKRFDATEYTIYLAQYKILQDMASIHNSTIPSQIMNTIIPCPDNLLASKLSIHKSTEWNREKEWRLFCTSDDPKFHLEMHSYIKKSPTALYLGRNITSINEKLLTMIAREQNIPVYKMILPENNRQYKLVPKLLNI